jgi:DNA-binding GntR family transcriptional regulator
MSSETPAITPALEPALPQLEAVKHPPMHEVVYERIRDALTSGDMLPGQRLVIRDLAQMLGTSVMPVREALRRLEAENAVELSGGGRTLAVPTLTADQYEELSLIRTELEGRAAYEAAQRVTKEELDEIARYLRAGDAAWEKDDCKGMTLNNRLFHRAVNMPAAGRCCSGSSRACGCAPARRCRWRSIRAFSCRTGVRGFSTRIGRHSTRCARETP